MSIEENLNSVKERIAKAAVRAGRSPKDISLIAVTKTHGADMINEAIDKGVSDIGENKPQEVRDKFEYVKSGVKWHLIGHLQTNKVKYIIDKVCLIHSVDSIHLMEEIDRQARKYGKIMDVLIQVNISGEESKSGIEPGELDALLKKAGELDSLRVKGLMTIAPIEGDASVHFKNMKALFDEYKEKSYPHVSMEELSMGMSGDFEKAIECGATMVRVGSAIFGKRDYTRR
ncbi:MAG: YggS family pyridoxal phosphate-dependent enzyme [Clostridiales bacterium]|nr:YggS family pyridoxal phosphate-dependent enzyme [Clostridiales bacterium]